jgi:hypothetical protein
MRFFIPNARDDEHAEVVYEAVRKFTEQESGKITATRYYAIHYRHNGKELRARVGDPDPLVGETVIAIFRSDRQRGPFFICTENRGVRRGSPIFASGESYTRAIHFEV